MRRIYKKALPFDSFMFNDLKKRFSLNFKPRIDSGQWNLDKDTTSNKKQAYRHINSQCLVVQQHVAKEYKYLNYIL